MVFERILYNPELGSESPEPPKDERKRWRQRAADRVRNLFRRRERPEAETPESAPETAEPPVTVERVTIERVTENPTFPEPETVYALPEQIYGTPETVRSPTFTPPEMGPPRQEVIETTATVLPLEPEPVTTPIPVAAREAEAAPRGTPPENGAEPQSGTSRSDATPSRPGSPATNDNSTPERRTTNPEKPSVLQRLNFYREQSAKRDAPSKEQSRGTEKGAANPVKGKGRAAGREVPKPKVPVKAAKIPKAPVR